MQTTKLSKQFNQAFLTLAIALCSSPAIALPPTNIKNNAPYIPPPDAGTPKPTGGTGSRGGCAIIPERPALASLVGQPHLMLTTRERPIFWIYVPYPPDEATSGVISLQQGDEAIYIGEFNLVATPGVVGIRLPETVPALMVGQEYDWFIDINCVAAGGTSLDSETSPGSLDGFVRRDAISAALANDLTQAQTDLDKVAAYGKHHMWYDWITELARLRLASENNTELSTIWTTVLSNEQAVLLTPWATESVVGEIETTR